MTRWTKRLTWGAERPEDWKVLRDGVPVGRVYRAPFVPGAPAFIWATWTHPATGGWAESHDEALERVRAEAGNLPLTVPPK